MEERERVRRGRGGGGKAAKLASRMNEAAQQCGLVIKTLEGCASVRPLGFILAADNKTILFDALYSTSQTQHFPILLCYWQNVYLYRPFERIHVKSIAFNLIFSPGNQIF